MIIKRTLTHLYYHCRYRNGLFRAVSGSSFIAMSLGRICVHSGSVVSHLYALTVPWPVFNIASVITIDLSCILKFRFSVLQFKIQSSPKVFLGFYTSHWFIHRRWKRGVDQANWCITTWHKTTIMLTNLLNSGDITLHKIYK